MVIRACSQLASVDWQCNAKAADAEQYGGLYTFRNTKCQITIFMKLYFTLIVIRTVFVFPFSRVTVALITTVPLPIAVIFPDSLTVAIF